MPTESKQPRRRKTDAEHAQHHRAEMERHARRAWLHEHPEIKDAIDLANKITKLEAGLDGRHEDLGCALVDAAHDIDEKCEHVIQAGMAGAVPTAQGKEQQP